MAQSFDAGHTETERGLPGPLQAGWYPGTWALPGTTLSAASFVVLVVVLLLLQISPTSRALFRLPIPAGWPALAAAVLAWGITLRCRNRPGRIWPRLWAFGLALGTSIVALVGFLGGDLGNSPFLHALSMASLMSSLTLTPRFLKLQPDRWLVQHVTALGLGIVLFLGLPASFAFGRSAVEDQKQRVTETIAELSREAVEVQEVSGFDWTTLAEQRQEALQQMRRVQDLPLEQWVPDRYLWRGAAILKEEERLAEAYRALLDALVESLASNRTPKLWQQQFVWNRELERWERDPVFPELSASVAGYHWRRGQMLRALEPPAGDTPVLRELSAYHGEKRQQVEERMKVLSETWAEDWVPPLIEALAPGSSAAATPMADLLQRPLLEDGTLRPVSLEKLLNLSLDKARATARQASGCGGKEYDEDDFQYFRVDCYAYIARLDPKNPGSDLRVEVRLVYRSEEKLEKLGRRELPAEMYFLFPVPSGLDVAQYREDVMGALAAGVREEHDRADLKMIDRSGAPGKGFSLETKRGKRLRVVSFLFENLSGGVQGIQARAYDRDRSL